MGRGDGYNPVVPGLFKFIMDERWFKWVIIFIFLFLLGARGLNEPDEGRYAEIGREMAETGDWLVPRIWYVPHLDKPPLTYWLAGASIAAFGINEWAIRLPFALAGLSGVWAVFSLGVSLGGRRVGQWAALILSCSLLYFGVARMVMTDIVLLQFVCWAIYFGWRSWRCLDDPEPAAIDEQTEDPDFTPEQITRGRMARQSFLWQLAAWAMCAGGVLTKGPLVFVLVAFALSPLLIRHRRAKHKLAIIAYGALPGLSLCALISLPWFLVLFERIPEASAYMTGNQAGHALEAEAQNRSGPIYFFLPILLFGFMPWTILLGWMWRRAHWARLTPVQRDGWAMLSGWAGLTFVFFSLISAKLPHYITPMMPALALLVALRWPDWKEVTDVPRWVWRVVGAGPFVVMLAMAIAYRFAFNIGDQSWIYWQAGIAVLGAVVVLVAGRNWEPLGNIRSATAIALVNLMLLVTVLPLIETRLRSNQTLRELGASLKTAYEPGDQIVVYNRIPQGLPLYTWPVINQTNRPWFLSLPQHRMPYHFPGNKERLANHTLSNLTDLGVMARTNRVLVVGYRNSHRGVSSQFTNTPFQLIATSGFWELFAGGPLAPLSRSGSE